jgi:hypothetical protein
MWSWDEVIAFYQVFADREDNIDSSRGKDMLNLIQRLRSEPELADMQPGTAMYTLYIALPDYEVESIHLHWRGSDTYSIFFTPENGDAPRSEMVTSEAVISKIKQYRERLLEKRDLFNEAFQAEQGLEAWDRLAAFYQVYAARSGTDEGEFGQGMLNLIEILKASTETRDLDVEEAGFTTLFLSLSGYDEEWVKVHWVAPDTYHFTVASNTADSPVVQVVGVAEALATLEQIVNEFRRRRDGG